MNELRKLKIPFAFSTRYVMGGPVCEAPQDAFIVKLAPEVCDAPHDLLLPIPDFSVPTDSEATVREALYTVLNKLANNEPVYVGCRGGQGRTGIFLSLLAKAVGVSKPIEYVRANFNPHAVERPIQEAYIDAFPVWPLMPSVFLMNFTALRRDWGCN